jgi:hypothetical protein
MCLSEFHISIFCHSDYKDTYFGGYMSKGKANYAYVPRQRDKWRTPDLGIIEMNSLLHALAPFTTGAWGVSRKLLLFSL